MGNDARIPPHFVGNRLHSFFKFRKSSAPNFSGSMSFQIGAVFSSSFPEDIRWQAAQSRSRQSLVRAHTDSPRREPECQSSEPGSTPPAAVWYRVRRFHPFPVRETLEGLWVLVGVVSAPGLSRVTSDCRGMRGSERPAPYSFAPEGARRRGAVLQAVWHTEPLLRAGRLCPCACLWGARSENEHSARTAPENSAKMGKQGNLRRFGKRRPSGADERRRR